MGKRIGLWGLGLTTLVVVGWPVIASGPLSGFARMGVLLAGVLVGLVFALVLFLSAEGWKQKVGILLGYPLLLFGWLVALPWQVRLERVLYFSTHETRLNELVQRIEQNMTIGEMSNGLRYWKTFNHQVYELRDTTNLPLLDSLLVRHKTSRPEFEELRRRLIDLEFISFERYDGVIFFTTDGLIDNCYGLAYSPTGRYTKWNRCGEIVGWRRIAPNWYVWTST